MYAVRKPGVQFMRFEPARNHWFQNNNNMPQRPPNQLRQGPGGRPNPNGPPRRGMSSLNRWLLVIVVAMLGIYLYQFFSSNNSSSTPQRTELSYSDFYKQISQGNVKSVAIIGSTDITGTLCSPVSGNTAYHVVQLPNGDPNLIPLLTNTGPTPGSTNPNY